jgi:hypothetical protein
MTDLTSGAIMAVFSAFVNVDAVDEEISET